jgi:hypothetical protein
MYLNRSIDKSNIHVAVGKITNSLKLQAFLEVWPDVL